MGDDRLRLIFTCCHPALAMEARVALTLRTLGGLTTGEIARAFLVAEPAMAQRLVRAKRKIAAAASPTGCRPTRSSADRLAGVLAVVYLIFNEGWSASAGDRLVRGELCAEAIRLGRLLHRLMPDDPEVAGLLALMLLHDSRREARVDDRGELVALDDQDRSRWDRGRIREGERLLDAALRRRRPGPTSCRRRSRRSTRPRRRPARPTTPRSRRSTASSRGAPSPVVEVNRAVAVGRAVGPDAGLAVLEPLLRSGALSGLRPAARRPRRPARARRRRGGRGSGPTRARRRTQTTRSPEPSWSGGRRGWLRSPAGRRGARRRPGA